MAHRPLVFIAVKCFEGKSPKGTYSCADFLMCRLWLRANAILKAYELTPEAFRQKFRNYCKQESQTRVEFAHEKK